MSNMTTSMSTRETEQKDDRTAVTGLLMQVPLCVAISSSSLVVLVLLLLLLFMSASWLRGRVRDVQARDREFDPRLSLIMLRRCAPRQGTLLTRALSTHE